MTQQHFYCIECTLCIVCAGYTRTKNIKVCLPFSNDSGKDIVYYIFCIKIQIYQVVWSRDFFISQYIM